MFPFLPKKRHCLQAVGRHEQGDGPVRFAEGFLRQADIAWTILDQENLNGPICLDCAQDFSRFPLKQICLANSFRGSCLDMGAHNDKLRPVLQNMAKNLLEYFNDFNCRCPWRNVDLFGLLFISSGAILYKIM